MQNSSQKPQAEFKQNKLTILTAFRDHLKFAYLLNLIQL